MRRLVGWMFAIAMVACTEEVRVGARCEYSSDCQAPYRCGFGRCRPECRVNVDCTLGAVCRIDPEGVGSCSLPDDPGCDGPDECAAGLACVNRACVDACDFDEDCASGNECWEVPSAEVSFCVDPRARPEAGMPVELDAGMSDAAPPPDAWVDPDAGRGCAASGCGEIVDVVVAFGHACALTAGGAVWCWGNDETGQASGRAGGSDTCGGVPCRTRPVRIDVGGGSKIVALAAGAGFTCGRREDGRVVCWGGNSSGALGRSDDLGPAPGEVESVVGATSLAAGSGFAIASVGAQLVGWGDNRNGQLQAASDPALPVAVAEGGTSLAVGGHHACVLRASAVRCWGANHFRQLGRALLGGVEWSAEEGGVEGLTGLASQVIVGASRSCVLREGAIVCWGYDVEGVEAPPVVVPHGEPMATLWSAPSSMVFCGLTSGGAPLCFGRSDHDSLWPDGTGNVRARPSPMHASLPLPVREITTDGATGCHVGGTGELWCWGDDSLGQLGRGSSGGSDRTPARVIIPAD